MAGATLNPDPRIARIPRIVHQTAPTRELSWEEHRLARRMRRQLPGWTYALWTDEDNRALIARDYPQHLVAYDAIQRGVMKADIARIAWLHSRGGFYLDTDYKLVQPIDDALLERRCILAIERGSADLSDRDQSFSRDFRIGNSIIAAQTGHPLLAAFIDDIFDRLHQQPLSEIEMMKISGPHALTRFYREHHAKFEDVWLAPQSLLLPELTLGGLSFERDVSTLGVHLCWGSWRTKHRVRNMRNLFRRRLTAII